MGELLWLPKTLSVGLAHQAAMTAHPVGFGSDESRDFPQGSLDDHGRLRLLQTIRDHAPSGEFPRAGVIIKEALPNGVAQQTQAEPAVLRSSPALTASSRIAQRATTFVNIS